MMCCCDAIIVVRGKRRKDSPVIKVSCGAIVGLHFGSTVGVIVVLEWFEVETVLQFVLGVCLVLVVVGIGDGKNGVKVPASYYGIFCRREKFFAIIHITLH
jgi:hypothetical protein